MRRLALALAIVIGASLWTAMPAAAAQTTMSSPASGQRVAGPVQVRVSVQKGLTEEILSVAVRLASGGSTYPGSRPAQLSCQSGCGTASQEWGGAVLDPRSPGAFGLSQPLPNGRLRLQPSTNGGGWGAGVEVVISYPPSAVSGLSGAAHGRRVELSWRRAPEPDVSGYHVERRYGNGGWSRVAKLGPYASSYAEQVDRDGRFGYRIITSRPDGVGGEFFATSSAVEVQADSPPPPPDDSGSAPPPTSGPSGQPSQPGGSPSGDGGTGGSSGGGGGGSSSGTGTVGGSSPGGSAGGSTAGPSGGSGGASRTVPRIRRRVAPPPAARPGLVLDAEAFALPEPQVAPRKKPLGHYGEGQPYSTELDYAGVDPVTGEPIRVPRTQEIRRSVPQAIQEIFLDRFDTRTLATSVAGGLLMVALALHLVRWMHAP